MAPTTTVDPVIRSDWCMTKGKKLLRLEWRDELSERQP